MDAAIKCYIVKLYGDYVNKLALGIDCKETLDKIKLWFYKLKVGACDPITYATCEEELGAELYYTPCTAELLPCVGQINVDTSTLFSTSTTKCAAVLAPSNNYFEVVHNTVGTTSQVLFAQTFNYSTCNTTETISVATTSNSPKYNLSFIKLGVDKLVNNTNSFIDFVRVEKFHNNIVAKHDIPLSPTTAILTGPYGTVLANDLRGNSVNVTTAVAIAFKNGVKSILNLDFGVDYNTEVFVNSGLEIKAVTYYWLKPSTSPTLGFDSIYIKYFNTNPNIYQGVAVPNPVAVNGITTLSATKQSCEKLLSSSITIDLVDVFNKFSTATFKNLNFNSVTSVSITTDTDNCGVTQVATSYPTEITPCSVKWYKNPDLVNVISTSKTPTFSTGGIYTYSLLCNGCTYTNSLFIGNPTAGNNKEATVCQGVSTDIWALFTANNPASPDGRWYVESSDATFPFNMTVNGSSVTITQSGQEITTDEPLLLTNTNLGNLILKYKVSNKEALFTLTVNPIISCTYTLSAISPTNGKTNQTTTNFFELEKIDNSIFLRGKVVKRLNSTCSGITDTTVYSTSSSLKYRTQINGPVLTSNGLANGDTCVSVTLRRSDTNALITVPLAPGTAFLDTGGPNAVSVGDLTFSGNTALFTTALRKVTQNYLTSIGIPYTTALDITFGGGLSGGRIQLFVQTSIKHNPTSVYVGVDNTASSLVYLLSGVTTTLSIRSTAGSGVISFTLQSNPCSQLSIVRNSNFDAGSGHGITDVFDPSTNYNNLVFSTFASNNNYPLVVSGTDIASTNCSECPN